MRLFILEKFNPHQYISINTFMSLLGIDNRGSTTTKFITDKIRKKTIDIQFIELVDKTSLSDGLITDFAISLEDTLYFKEHHYSIPFLQNEVGNRVFDNIKKKEDFTIIKLQETVAKGMFVPRNEIENSLLYQNCKKENQLINSDDFMLLSKFKKELNIGDDALKKVLEQYNVKTHKYHINIFISLKDVEFLKSEQINKQKLLDDYYTGSEVRRILNKFFPKGKTNQSNIKRIPYDLLIPSSIPADKTGYLWLKEDVHRYKKERENNEDLKNNLSVFLEDEFSTFLYRLDVLNLSTLLKYDKTKELWLNYVKMYFLNSSANEVTKQKKISNFIEITTTLFSFLTKEIYSLTSNELNLVYFNDKINISHQFTIYNFLKSLYETFELQGKKTNFLLQTLNNPYSDYEPSKSFDTDCYTFEEYQELFDYCSNIDFHKNLVISDIKKSFSNKNPTHYDSVWLYTLILLTNNWRHSTVMQQLPNFPIEEKEYNSIDWFENNDLSKEQAKEIIHYIGRFLIKIEKTGAESLIRVPERLEIAFSTAYCLCQLRKNQIISDSSQYLIHLPSDKTLVSRRKNSFFYHFKNNTFVFENRKMNRTLTTLIWSIIRYKSENNEDALKASQNSRKHFNENTTNIYIKLTRKQIDDLTEQLFSKQQFGFIYNYFANVLFGEENLPVAQTNNILALQKEFGDVFKIEATSGLINKLIREQDEVLTLLQTKSIEELHDLYFKVISNSLPGKEPHYQCIEPNCVRKTISCKECPFSIPNIFILDSLMDEYERKIQSLQQFEDLLEGEKMKRANDLFRFMKTIKEAKETFGDEVIYNFFNGGRTAVQHLSKTLPKKSVVQQYLT